jgi:hypothetical protein
MSDRTNRDPTTTVRWIDRRGKEQVRTIRHVIDVRDFLGTPGYPLLFVAANTHLSVADIWDYLCELAAEWPSVERTDNWIQKRRWLFQKPAANPLGRRPNRDGKDERALKIMRANPGLSVRNLSVLLKENGISREREWVRKHRCEVSATVNSP